MLLQKKINHVVVLRTNVPVSLNHVANPNALAINLLSHHALVKLNPNAYVQRNVNVKATANAVHVKVTKMLAFVQQLRAPVRAAAHVIIVKLHHVNVLLQKLPIVNVLKVHHAAKPKHLVSAQRNVNVKVTVSAALVKLTRMLAFVLPNHVPVEMDALVNIARRKLVNVLEEQKLKSGGVLSFCIFFHF